MSSIIFSYESDKVFWETSNGVLWDLDQAFTGRTEERILVVSVYRHNDGSQNSQEMKWGNDTPNNLLKILQ